MNELIEKSDDKWKILLDNKQVLALIKGEYLYYTGIKKNLENKLSSLNDEEKELYLWKINITKEQLLLLKNNHQKIVEWKKEDFAYLKHDIEIQVEKKWDNYVVKWLDNFTY
jgi:tRNA U34 2-thiouridine synthase MnmA/TrmU